jgi:hypothetical protein
MSVCKQVLCAMARWWELEPRQSVFAAGAGSGLSLNAAARSAAGDWALAYVSGPGPVSITMADLVRDECASASWIDPRSAARRPVGRFPTAGRRSFRPPADWEDALLLFERTGLR